MIKLDGVRAGKCPDEATLAAYLGGVLKDSQMQLVEEHIAVCHLCLESIKGGYSGDRSYNENKLPQSKQEAIRKAKGIAKMDSKKRRKGNLWLIATIVAFILSFTVPRYFAQFLAAALILGLKWVSESESIRTLIVAMDMKRQHERETGRRV